MRSDRDPSQLGGPVKGLSVAWHGSTGSMERPQNNGKSSRTLCRQEALLPQLDANWTGGCPRGRVPCSDKALQLLPSWMTWKRRAQPLRQQQGRTLCTTLGMMPRCWKLCCPPVMV